jgi:hypothetical protein
MNEYDSIIPPLMQTLNHRDYGLHLLTPVAGGRNVRTGSTWQQGRMRRYAASSVGAGG